MLYQSTTRRRFATLVGTAGITFFGSGIASASGRDHNFRAPLSGDEEVPPVDTHARGNATFQLSRDRTELRYRLIFANIFDITQAHIHTAPPGVNGPVVAWLYPDSPPPQPIPGRFDGILTEDRITANDLVGPLEEGSLEDLITLMSAGQTYVNVHTSAHPPGEVRGQIR